MHDIEYLPEPLVVIIKAVTGEHGPECVEHGHVEGRVHGHGATVAPPAQPVDEAEGLGCQPPGHGLLAQAEGLEVAHREAPVLRPDRALREQDA